MPDVGAYGHFHLGALILPRALIDDKPIKEKILGFEIAGLKTLYKGWTEFMIVTVRMPGGETIEREVEDHGAAAAVLPYDPERRTAILVRQFRAPVCVARESQDLLEAIAGIVENENPSKTASREAMEEAGLELDTLEPAGTHWTAPGISTERMALFLAPYRASQRTGDGGGIESEHEQIAVEEIKLTELAERADNGELNDLKTFALVQTLRLRHPKLFTA
jgi:nudix-type nucleoside diphosphatase (YffH/AdpP family)